MCVGNNLLFKQDEAFFSFCFEIYLYRSRGENIYGNLTDFHSKKNIFVKKLISKVCNICICDFALTDQPHSHSFF